MIMAVKLFISHQLLVKIIGEIAEVVLLPRIDKGYWSNIIR